MELEHRALLLKKRKNRKCDESEEEKIPGHKKAADKRGAIARNGIAVEMENNHCGKDTDAARDEKRCCDCEKRHAILFREARRLKEALRPDAHIPVRLRRGRAACGRENQSE